MDIIVLVSIITGILLVLYFRYRKYRKSGRKSDLSSGLISQLLVNLLIVLSPNAAATSDALSSKGKNKKWLLKRNIPLIIVLFFTIILTAYFILRAKM